MRTPWRLMVGVVVAALAAGAVMAAPRLGDAPAGRGPAAALTAEQEVAVEEARELARQLEVARLELRLLELRQAPEAEIAAKAEEVFRLRGRLHALRGTRPEGVRGQALGRGPGRIVREFAGPGAGRGRGAGAQGWRRGAGPGAPEPGFGARLRGGPHPGFGRGPGAGREPTWGQGEGWRQRLRERMHRLPDPPLEEAPEAPVELEPER